jgi:hypothetical protein
MKTPEQMLEQYDALGLHFSKRGMPLVFHGEPPECGVVTVENYCKWYGLYVVKPNSAVKHVPFPDDYAETGETPCADHVPNPRTVCRWVEKNGYIVCEQSLEMMIGRWEREVGDRYDDTYD